MRQAATSFHDHPAPDRAIRRAGGRRGRRRLAHAWAIALAALGLSFVGLLAAGAGFLVTSVWFWQVAGFSFARVFSRTHHAQAGS
jgi:hypothetical protein